MTTTTFETERAYGARRTIGQAIPYILLTLSILPILIGYAWILIATFSYRTQGLTPVDAQGNFGGFTLQNWSFLSDPLVWKATLNSFAIAVSMVIGVGFVSSLTGYALSRMNFRGRKTFLGTTMILHAFKPEMLLISIFMVLLFIGGLPLLGKTFGFNTVGGGGPGDDHPGTAVRRLADERLFRQPFLGYGAGRAD